MVSNYSVFPAGRGRGKTTWMLTQITDALAKAQRVAVVVSTTQQKDHLIRSAFRDLPVDVITERTFPRARGRIYDQIYVDNADLFHDNPVELCLKTVPGTPVTFTYTPHTSNV